MDTNRVNPDERIASVFASVVEAFDRLLSPLELTEEQAAEVKADLFLWFHRFCRRPSHDRLPVKPLQLALIWAAWRLASELWELEHHGVAIFPRDPKEIARELGIMPDEPEKKEPPR